MSAAASWSQKLSAPSGGASQRAKQQSSASSGNTAPQQKQQQQRVKRPRGQDKDTGEDAGTDEELDGTGRNLLQMSLSTTTTVRKMQALAMLLEGMKVADAAKKLRGITCGDKPTSCSDQLAKVLDKLAKTSK